MKTSEEADFDADAARRYDEKAPDLSKSLVIAFVGKVSSGKSSLINAFLRRDRSTTVTEVGARSGVTTELKVLKLDEHVTIVDSPGLSDLKEENSRRTLERIAQIDVGIFVVTGSADTSQKADFDHLRTLCAKIFLVLNKVDEWDDLEESELHGVVEQWRVGLGVETLYPTCTKGFNPRTRADQGMDIRGVDKLRDDVENFVQAEGKALVLTRVMGEKRSYAMKLIAAAVSAVALEALLPGAAAYITGTQAVTIVSLYYIYTGRVMSKTNALAMIPVFAAESVGSTLFLWVKSFLPPTGVLDAAAAAVAATVTAGMLLTVNALLASGSELKEREAMRSKYAELRGRVASNVGKASPKDLGKPAFWQKLLKDIMYA